MVEIKNHIPKMIGEVLVENGVITDGQLTEVLKIQKGEPYKGFGEIVRETLGVAEELIEKIYLEQNIVPLICPELIRRLDEIIKRDFLLSKAGMEIESLIAKIDTDLLWWAFTKSKSRRFTCQNGLIHRHPEEKKDSVAGEIDIAIMTPVSNDAICRGTIVFSYISDQKHITITNNDDNLKYGILFRIKEIFNELLKKQRESRP